MYYNIILNTAPSDSGSPVTQPWCPTNGRHPDVQPSSGPASQHIHASDPARPGQPSIQVRPAQPSIQAKPAMAIRTMHDKSVKRGWYYNVSFHLIEKLTRFEYCPNNGLEAGPPPRLKRRTFRMAVSVSWYDSLLVFSFN